MECYDHIEMRAGGREEYMELISEDFPYLAVLSDHDRYADKTVPWHWHQELELFYVLDGVVDYATPNVRRTLGPGAAGLVNANVLHMTHAHENADGVSLLIHEFRADFLAAAGTHLARTYVEPLLKATSLELLVLEADDGATERLRKRLLASFDLEQDGVPGWELHMRDELSEIWLGLFELARPHFGEGPALLDDERSVRLKTMLNFIGAHYPEHLGVADIAASAFSSERACHRTFQDCLGMTPAQYLRGYRIQQACRMLAHTTRPLGQIAQMSGLGTASHFGQVFRDAMGCTPSAYRASWQDFDSYGQRRE